MTNLKPKYNLTHYIAAIFIIIILAWLIVSSLTSCKDPYDTHCKFAYWAETVDTDGNTDTILVKSTGTYTTMNEQEFREFISEYPGWVSTEYVECE